MRRLNTLAATVLVDVLLVSAVTYFYVRGFLIETFPSKFKDL